MRSFYEKTLIKWLLKNNPSQLKEVCQQLNNVLTFELISFVNDINNNQLYLYKKKGNYPTNFLANLCLKNLKTGSLR